MELFRLLGTIAVDNTEANNAIDNTTARAQDAEGRQKSAFAGIGTAAGNLAIGIGTAAVAIGGAWIAAIEGTREYRAEMGKLESAFLTAGHSTETAKNTYSELNSVMRDSQAAVEASQHLSKITDSEKELSTWTDICTGVYSEFGASIPIESLTESALETQKNGILTGGLVDALVWAGISEEEFQAQLDACTTEQERQNLIMNTLNDTYSTAADQYRETNADVIEAEKANESLADAFAELGAIGEPILTLIKEKVAEMVSAAVPKIQEFIEKIKDAIKWVKENENTIKIWVGVILGAVTAIGTFLLILNWGTIMAAASKAISAVRLAVLAFNTTLLANPIGLIVSLIAGLVVAFLYLWNNVDGFKEFWINTWEIIKEKASASWKWISSVFENIGKWFSEKFSQIREAGSEVMNNLEKFFSDAWNYIKNIWNSCVSFFQSIWNGIVKVFSVVGSWIGGQFEFAWNMVKKSWNFYKSFFSGVWSGIKQIFSVVSSWFSGIFQSAWSGISRIWNTAKSFFSGVWSSIRSVFGNVTGWFRDIFGKAFGFVKDIILKTFSAGGKVFSNIKSGLERTFKTLVNTVIGGINTIISVPFKAVNSMLKTLKNIEVLKLKPFTWITTFSIPKIPKLEQGGILKRGQVGILEGSGDEAVVPLENNTGWIDRVASQIYQKGDTAMIESLLKYIVSLIENALKTDLSVYLDTGELVGAMAPGINRELGSIATKQSRGSM